MFKDFTKYEVYSDGRIWSYSRNKWLKPITKKDGYQQVHLSDNNGNRRWYLLHRVVWESVTGEPIPSNMEINHISENKTENFFENLQLLSHKENINFGTRTQRCSKQVGAFNNNGELVITFPSAKEAGRQGFCYGSVAACCRGEQKTHKGFIFRYI